MIELMTVRMILIGMFSSEKSRPDCKAAIAQSELMSRSGASSSQISSNSISFHLGMEKAWQYQDILKSVQVHQ